MNCSRRQLEAANKRIADLESDLLWERSAVELKNKRIEELETELHRMNNPPKETKY
jgi:hypothetical protein